MTNAHAIPLDLPEVACASPVVVIADLHLDLADERGGRGFAQWLSGLRGVGALAILEISSTPGSGRRRSACPVPRRSSTR